MELFEAIPDRIEVSGQSPTWRVTGGSFEGAVSYAEEAFGKPVVVAREDHCRWWPRVTLTVTTDPELAAQAPPFEELSHPPEPVEPEPYVEPKPPVEAAPEVAEDVDDVEGTGGVAPATLESIFAYQEEVRLGSFPEQRRGGGMPGV
ncbi:MAG: hypothetical protein ABI776_04425 [Nocardioidaceae bacterium]